MQYTEQDFVKNLQRAFRGQSNNTYIEMDGRAARNEFLARCWDYAVDQGWLEVKTIELEQDTFMKGYLTEKGKVALKLP